MCKCMCKNKKCKFCFCKIIFILVIIGLVVSLFFIKDSSDYFVYKTSLNLKNGDFEKVMTNINVDKIIESKIEHATKDTVTANNSFLSSTISMLLNGVKDKFSGQIRNAIYDNIENKGAKLKDTSRFQIIKFLIAKKNDNFILDKKEIDKNKVKYIIRSKGERDTFTLSKNNDGKWEITDISSNNLLNLKFLKF